MSFRWRRNARRGGTVPPAPAFSRSGLAPLAEGDGAAGRMEESVLPNGIRVLTESIPGLRSVALGVWVRQGAAHEPRELGGASHLLEHLVFKGTERRTPREIAMALERLGGSLDAFTSREHTAFQARVLPEHLPVALDVLADLVLDPVLRAEDLDLEREVVLEEIATVEDTPDDLVFELHGEALWGGHPYGRSIMGTRESVSGMGVEALRELHRTRYREGELLVAAAGYLEHARVHDIVEARFGHLGTSPGPEVPPVTEEAAERDVRVPREGSQTHIVVGTRTPPRSSEDRFALILLSSAMGGGMSSRLFQRVREEMGLAYTVYSFQSFYSRAGVSGVYVGTRPEWSDRAVDAIFDELARVARDGLPEEELREVKDQVKGQVMLSLESTSSRLFRLAGFAIYDMPYLNLDELLRRIEAVDGKQIRRVARRTFDPERQTVLRLGPA